MNQSPPVITDFFRLKNEQDDEGLWKLFADDAVVVDAGEGKEMHGAYEIKKWIAKSISGLNLQTEIRGAEEHDGEWVIDTVMTGNFKASPARFQYFIKINGGKVSYLRAEFLGSVK
jgi:hypothetical protein